MRDALLAYEHSLRQQTLSEYRHRYLVWAVQSPYLPRGRNKPPKPPRILRDEET